jgi:o-succinylbenzoate synthase
MRIVGAEVVPYALPFREPYVTARGTLERREMALLRLRTDGGIEGLGEAVPLSLRGEATLAEVVTELEDATKRLVGTDLDAMPGPDEPDPVPTNASPSVAAAVQIARLDLAAKLADLPLWQLLGAPECLPVPCNATLTAGVPADVAAQAERWTGLGFATFKLKVGMPGDVAQVEAVRTAVGAGGRIRVDANGAWSPDEAILKLGAMERQGIELAEQPSRDLADLRLVNQQTAIPIAADESVASPSDAQRAVELGACDLATVKLSKVGGVGPARTIAGILPVYLSSALDGPVGIAAAAHAAQLLRDHGEAGVAHGLATQLLFSATIAATECGLRGGELLPPAGPGLGVELDEQALARHRL